MKTTLHPFAANGLHQLAYNPAAIGVGQKSGDQSDMRFESSSWLPDYVVDGDRTANRQA
jgi:hypothetical protein